MSTPKDLTVYFLDRDFDESADLPDLKYTINRYSKTAQGGPKEAHITAFGHENELWRLVDMLRYGVEIYDHRNEIVWWGIVSEVKIRVSNLVYSISLDNMANRVKVAYTQYGERRDTSWAQDDTSVNVYGTKEILITMTDSPDGEAEQRRDSALDSLKYPVPIVEFGAQSEGSYSANIKCSGYFETLEWKYYSQAKGLEAHTGTGVGLQEVGVIYTSACLDFDADTNKIKDWSEGLAPFKKDDKISIVGTSSNNGVFRISQGTSSGSNITVVQALTDENNANGVDITSGCKMAQGFVQKTGSSWNAAIAYVRAKTEGSPTDDLTVDIYDNNSGSPGTSQANGLIAASDMDSTMKWREITMSACVTLTDNTRFFLVVSRSSVPSSASNHYIIDVDEGLGYDPDVFFLHTSNGWDSRFPLCDMLFKVLGTQPITEQITETVSDSGQFIVGTTIDSVTVPETNQYRDGEATALTEVKELLDVGTTSDLRLLCEVNSSRRLRVYEEDDQGDDDYQIGADGTIRDGEGVIVDKQTCPVGRWFSLNELVPTVANKTLISDPTYFFADEAEYFAQSDIWVPRSKNADSVWDIGEIKDG